MNLALVHSSACQKLLDDGNLEDAISYCILGPVTAFGAPIPRTDPTSSLHGQRFFEPLAAFEEVSLRFEAIYLLQPAGAQPSNRIPRHSYACCPMKRRLEEDSANFSKLINRRPAGGQVCGQRPIRCRPGLNPIQMSSEKSLSA